MSRFLICISLILIIAVSAAFHSSFVQTVEADEYGPIVTIKSDGSIDPPTANLTLVGNVYTMTEDLTVPSSNSGIYIEKGNIVLDGGGHTIHQDQPTWETYGVVTVGVNNVIVRNVTIEGLDTGVCMTGGTWVTLENTLIRGTYGHGVWISTVSWAFVHNCTVTGTRQYGVSCENSANGYIADDTLTLNGEGIYVYSSRPFNITGNIITENTYESIYIYTCYANLLNPIIINNNTITQNDNGILNWKSYVIDIRNNTVCRNTNGLWFRTPTNNNGITLNSIMQNTRGIVFDQSSDNSVIQNRFLNNTWHVYDLSRDDENKTASINYYNGTYPVGGNYWTPYTGTDIYSGENQNQTGSDGMGDTPLILDANNTDSYPLMIHDMAILGITPSKTIIPQGRNVTVTVQVMNEGTYLETFNLTAAANLTTIEQEDNLTLPSGNTTLINLTFGTAGLDKDNYVIVATANSSQEETELADNSYTLSDTIYIRTIGDVTSKTTGVPDYRVDMRDIGLICGFFGATQISPRWEQVTCRNCDLNDDKKVDMRDIGLVCANFGQT